MPLGEWLHAETDEIILRFTSDGSVTRDGFDITARCMPIHEGAIGYTWTDRRNAFNSNDACYLCGPCPGDSDICTSGERAFTCQSPCHSGYNYIHTGAVCTCSLDTVLCNINGDGVELVIRS